MDTRHRPLAVRYFAFGSNLDEAQMAHRCPSARYLARAALRDHALLFGGYSARWGGPVATLVAAPGARALGVVYAMTDDDLQRLDCYEGHPFAYRRGLRDVHDEYGRIQPAHLYVQPAVAPAVPGDEYFSVIWRAYKRLGFSTDLLLDAVSL